MLGNRPARRLSPLSSGLLATQKSQTFTFTTSGTRRLRGTQRPTSIRCSYALYRGHQDIKMLSRYVHLKSDDVVSLMGWSRPRASARPPFAIDGAACFHQDSASRSANRIAVHDGCIGIEATARNSRSFACFFDAHREPACHIFNGTHFGQSSESKFAHMPPGRVARRDQA